MECEANDAQVEQACGDLRGCVVEAMVMTRPPKKTPRHKLIWMRAYEAEKTTMSDAERMEYLGERWKGTLAILGKSAGES